MRCEQTNWWKTNSSRLQAVHNMDCLMERKGDGERIRGGSVPNDCWTGSFNGSSKALVLFSRKSLCSNQSSPSSSSRSL